MGKNEPTSALDVGQGVNLHDPAVVIDLFERAARASLDHPLRQGATVHLPDKGRLLMTGDLHDHGYNLQRIIHLAKLDESKDHHLILHEIVHGEHKIEGRDMSVRIFAKVAALKLAYPEQVHLMMGNHELAQFWGEGILKAGISVVEVFDDGVDFLFAEDAEAVRIAMNKLIRSMLLAVRCPDGIMCCHSVPGPRRIDEFDTSVIDRELTDDDLTFRGSAYDMVWGRNHSQELADDLSDDWGVRLFVMGHQPAEMGYEVEGDSMLILASDHSHGVALPIDLGKHYASIDDLIGEIVPLASIML